jgi:hypothetical protein
VLAVTGGGGGDLNTWSDNVAILQRRWIGETLQGCGVEGVNLDKANSVSVIMECCTAANEWLARVFCLRMALWHLVWSPLTDLDGDQ